MQQFFRFSIEEEVMRINTHHDKDIIAKFNNHEAIFKNLNGLISIELERLRFLVDQEQSGKVHFYYREFGAEDEKIRITDDMELTIESNLMTTFNEKQWIFYLTTKGTFNCLFEKVPSYKSYYLENHLEEIKFVGNYLQIQLNLVTKYLKAHTAKLIIRNRRTIEELALTGELSLLKKKNHDYLQTLIVKTNKQNICQMITNRNNTTDSDRLDIYVNIQYLESEVTGKDIRVNHSHEKESNYAKELWVDKFSDDIYGFFPSFRQNLLYFFLHTAVLSEESYKTYLAFTKCNNKTSDRKILVIGEYPTKAQDNGLHLFKYVNDFLRGEFECYYVISKESKDLSNLVGYESRILEIKSPDHIEKLLQADIIAHTHSDHYLHPFISKALSEKLQGKKIFLQHGITLMKDGSNLYAKQAYPFHTDYVIVSSKREKLLVIDEWGYTENQVLLTGLPRFDLLLKKEKRKGISGLKKRFMKSDLNLLIMPTYRKGIKSEVEFIASGYYKAYQALINSEELSNLAHKHSLKIQFYLHTRFQAYSKCFTSDFVEIISEGNQNVQDLLKNSDLMITDYSSVGLDFSLMYKRVIYYHFDYKKTEYAKFVDVKNLLPGEIVHTEKAVLNEIREFINSNQKIKEKHKNKIKDLFMFIDRKSNHRLHKEMKRILDYNGDDVNGSY